VLSGWPTGISAPVPERPRILLLVTLAETGGAQTYVAALVPALVVSYEVTVAAHGDGPLRTAAQGAGADFVSLRHVRRPTSAWRDVLGLIELVRLMRRTRPHLLHASSSKAGILGRIAGWLTRVPVRIFTVHGWAFSAYSGRSATLYRWAERLVRPLTSTTVCVSESERAAGIEAGTCDPRATVVIRNGIDLAGRRIARPVRDTPRIVSVGRLQAPKDFLTFVRALGRMPGRRFEALVVGDGPDRPLVEAELDRLGLQGAVVLTGERDDVAELLADSDIFVLASHSEALPMTVLEAMAAGLPVVAPRVGGLAELVLEGETGFLVPPGEPLALANAICALVDDPTLRERLGATGRSRVETHFTLESFLEAHLDLYRRELDRLGVPVPIP
jgi:glycosyltransferase involved in cell wall biosynthesis